MIEIKQETIDKALLALYCLCIVSSNIGKWSNYINGVFIAVSFIELIYTRKDYKLSILSLVWAAFIIIYPILDHMLRGETDLTVYILLPYVSAICFIINTFRIMDLIFFTKLLKGWGVIQAFAIILSQTWRRLYSILAGRIMVGWTPRMTGFGVDPAVTSIALGMGIGLTVFELLYCKEKMSRLKKSVTYIELFAMFYGLVFTGKRLALVATIVLLMCAVILMTLNNPRKLVLRIVLFGLLLLAGTYLSIKAYQIWGDSNGFGRLGATLIGLSEGDDISNNREIWANLMQEWRIGHEIFGIGWESFPNRIVLAGVEGIQNGHNVFLQILCETGYVGAFSFCASLVYSVIFSIKYCINSRLNVYPDDIQQMAFFSFFSIGFFFFYCMTGNAIYDAYSYLYFFAGVGIISRLSYYLLTDA